MLCTQTAREILHYISVSEGWQSLIT